MMELMILFLFALAIAACLGYVGRWIAGEKNRSGTEGFLFGFFLGPVGLIIEVCLPTKEESENYYEEPERHRKVDTSKLSLLKEPETLPWIEEIEGPRQKPAAPKTPEDEEKDRLMRYLGGDH